MKTFIALSVRDYRDLLMACLLGIGSGVGVMAMGLLALRIAGQAPGSAANLLLPLSGLAGAGVGLMLFLRRRLWQPLHQLIRSLPRRATQKVTIATDTGIAPLRLLSHRIHDLLDQLQGMLDRNQRDFHDLAHDLRGPLTRLLLRIEALHEQEPPDAELIAGLDADLKALLALDQELGDLAETPERPLHRDWLLLEPFCQDIAASYGPHLVTLAIEPSIALPVDRRMLQRALNNLIDNALDYGGAPVRISASASADLVSIVVEDAGRAGGSTASSELRLPPPHQGLGLTIARGFCLSHGGSLDLGTSPLGGWQVRLNLHSAPPAEQAA
jgi:signal transduction histidine kinase